MTAEQSAAYIGAQTASMLVELEAMKVANADRAQNGYAPAYGEKDFLALIDRYGMHHNNLMELIRP